MRPLAPPLTIPLRPSRRLSALLLVAHGVAAFAVLAAELPPWFAAPVIALIFLSLWRRWRGTDAVACLVLRGDGRIERVGADGTAAEAEVLGDTVVTAGLVVLNHAVGGRRRSLVLPGDAFPVADDFRRLRLWLRWRREVTPAAGDPPAG